MLAHINGDPMVEITGPSDTVTLTTVEFMNEDQARARSVLAQERIALLLEKLVKSVGEIADDINEIKADLQTPGE